MLQVPQPCTIRVDRDHVAVRADRRGGTGLDAVAAAGLRPAVRTQGGLEGWRSGFLELADELPQRAPERLLEGIAARRSRRRLDATQQRLGRQVEHEVEAFAARASRRAKSIAPISPQAATQAPWLRQASTSTLQVPADRALGTGLDAGVAAHARSRSIGLCCVHSSSKAPRWPPSRTGLPDHTGYALTAGGSTSFERAVISTAGSKLPAGAPPPSAAPASPMISRLRPALICTAATGSGSAKVVAAAINAASLALPPRTRPTSRRARAG